MPYIKQAALALYGAQLVYIMALKVRTAPWYSAVLPALELQCHLAVSHASCDGSTNSPIETLASLMLTLPPRDACS